MSGFNPTIPVNQPLRFGDAPMKWADKFVGPYELDCG
jgi:hypothetical protein